MNITETDFLRLSKRVKVNKGEKGDRGEKGEKGDAAPQVVIAYSSDAESWHAEYTPDDAYIRFSMNGTSTWSEAMYIKGRQGEQGSQGADGHTGLSFRMRGAYDSSASYVNDSEYIDCVTYCGSSYYAKQTTTGNLPTDDAYWGMLARKGLDGTGTGGITGPASNTDGKFPQWDGTDTNALKDGYSLSDLMLVMYPVGAVYISVINTSPAVLFGGTWLAISAGKTLVGFDSSDDDFNSAESTGGTKVHTLLDTEMPSHSHTQNPHTHGEGTLAAISGGAHTHELQWVVNGNYISLSTGGSGPTESGYSTGYSSVTVHRGALVAASAGSHGHNISGSAANTTAINQNAGGNMAHNNMPPYVVVYMWKRTA